MRSSLLAPAALALAIIAAAPARAQQLAAPQQLPAGRTLAYIEILDGKRARTAFDGTDMGKACGTLKPFVDTLLDGLDAQMAAQKDQLQQQIGVKPDDAIALLTGGLAVALVDTAPAGGEPQPRPVALFPAAAKPTVAAIVATLKKQQGANAPFYVIDRPGVVALAFGDQNALAPAGAATLDKDAQFQAVRAKVCGQAPGLAFVYGDGSHLLEMAKGDPDAQKKLETAGIGTLKALGIGLACDAGQLHETVFIDAPGEPKGIFKVFAGAMKPLDLAKLGERSPADGTLFAMRLDLGALLDGAIALAKEIEPKQAKDIDQGLKDFEKQLGFRLHADILDPFGDVWTIQGFPTEDGLFAESILAVTVKDGARAQKTIAALYEKAGFEVSSVERGGRTIQYVRATLGELGEVPRDMSPQAMQIAGAFAGSASAWVLDGDTLYMAGLPQAIEAWFDRKVGATLGSTATFKQAAADARGSCAFTYATLKPILAGVYQIGMKVLRAVEPGLRRAGISVDSTELPRTSEFARSILPSTTSLRIDGDGIAFRGNGGVPVFLTAVPIIAAVAIPNIMSAKKHGVEAAVIGNLRSISSSQQMFKMQKGDAFAKSLQELAAAGFIDQQLASGMSGGYAIRILKADGFQWSAVAMPFDPSQRSFFIDESGVIRYATGGEEPTVQSEPLGE